eukprot:scaffold358_cov256-Pinguiococcus_pyrenoidosus.AAC.7
MFLCTSARLIAMPVFTEPVKKRPSMGCESSASPALGPPATHWKTPWGSPASSRVSSILLPDSSECSLGLYSTYGEHPSLGPRQQRLGGVPWATHRVASEQGGHVHIGAHEVGIVPSADAGYDAQRLPNQAFFLGRSR